MILGSGTQHGRAADVDVLDGIFQRAFIFGNGLLERIQIDHHHVDGWNAVLLQCRNMFRKIAPRQNAAVHFRMQRLDAAIQHFGEAGVIGHFGDCHAILGQQFCGAAGRQNIDAHGRQRTREVEYASFIGNGNKCLFDHDEVL